MNGGGTTDGLMNDLVSRELEPGETVIWCDRPVPKYFTEASIPAFVIGIPWTLLLGFLLWASLGLPPFDLQDCQNCDNSDGIVSAIIMLPFVFLGLLMLTAPISCRNMSFKTLYVVTDRRAIVINAWKKLKVKNVMPESLARLILEENKDGTGHIYIETESHSNRIGPSKIELFLDVRESGKVEALLRELAAHSRK